MITNSSHIKRSISKDEIKETPRKRQYRNENEKRRRDLFSHLVNNLEEILPSNNERNHKLDKASVLHQAAVYLKKHQADLQDVKHISSSSCSSQRNDVADLSWRPSSDLTNVEEWLQIATESMHCFFLVLKCDSCDSQIVYVSPSIRAYLGYDHKDLLRHSLYECVHRKDHQRLREYFFNDHHLLQTCPISWKRCSTDEYEQGLLTGAFRTINNDDTYFMSIVQLNTLDRPLAVHSLDHCEEFVTSLNVNGRFVFIDSRGRDYLGYESFDIIGRTFFDFVHPDDVPLIIRAQKLWKQNGSGTSEPYRFLTRGQQWVYLQTHSQMQINSWTGKAESYICTNNILLCSENSPTTQSTTLDSKLLHSSKRSIDVSSGPPMSLGPVECSLPPFPPSDKSSPFEREIASFLNHLQRETFRANIRGKLLQRRQDKTAEIQIRQDEIQVIDDMVRFIDQHQSKPSSTITPMDEEAIAFITEELGANMHESNPDSRLWTTLLRDADEEINIQSNSKDDPLGLLFSMPSTTYDLLSPSSSAILQDIHYFTSTNN